MPKVGLGSKPEKHYASICFPLFTQQRTSPDTRHVVCECRFCYRSRHTDGAGQLMQFLKPSLSPAGLCGRLSSTLLTLATLTQRAKGRTVVAGRPIWASLRRFCAIAANVNSNWAPHGPRNRSRPSRKIRFKCANSISTRFLSRDDCLNASVLASARATSRASS